jgi:hypothetical protein
MLKVHETPDADPVPPECRATVERIQRALDGEVRADALNGDPHVVVCAACRERIRAARVLLSVLATPPEPVAVPAGFSDRVVRAVREDRENRRARTRRRTYATGLALIAATLLVVLGWSLLKPPARPEEPVPLVPGEVVHKPAAVEVAPAPRARPAAAPEPAPAPQPIHIGDEFAKAGEALFEAPKPLTDSVAVAPKILDAFTGPFKNPGGPPNPMGTVLEPARKSIAELPAVARTGLEPVTDTAEKAFIRFLRDMGAVKPNS